MMNTVELQKLFEVIQDVRTCNILNRYDITLEELCQQYELDNTMENMRRSRLIGKTTIKKIIKGISEYIEKGKPEIKIQQNKFDKLMNLFKFDIAIKLYRENITIERLVTLYKKDNSMLELLDINNIGPKSLEYIIEGVEKYIEESLKEPLKTQIILNELKENLPLFYVPNDNEELFIRCPECSNLVKYELNQTVDCDKCDEPNLEISEDLHLTVAKISIFFSPMFKDFNSKTPIEIYQQLTEDFSLNKYLGEFSFQETALIENNMSLKILNQYINCNTKIDKIMVFKQDEKAIKILLSIFPEAFESERIIIVDEIEYGNYEILKSIPKLNIIFEKNGRNVGRKIIIRDEQIDKIKELYKQGLSYRAISKEVGLNSSYVYRIIKESTKGER